MLFHFGVCPQKNAQKNSASKASRTNTPYKPTTNFHYLLFQQRRAGKTLNSKQSQQSKTPAAEKGNEMKPQNNNNNNNDNTRQQGRRVGFVCLDVQPRGASRIDAW
jgi:hypothetical protein